MPPLLIVYVHGGGFCSHTATEPLFAAAALPRLAARGIYARVLALDYSLDAGEEGRSRMVRQVLHGYERLVAAAHRETKIVLAGDSAGGHLVVAVVRALLADRNVRGEGKLHARMPDALIAISPWAEVAISPTTDAGSTGRGSIGMGASGFVHSPSRTRNARRRTDYLSLRLLEMFALRAGHVRDHLLPSEKAEDAALCERTGVDGGALLPPTIIFIGGGEVLAEDGRRLSAALSRLCSGHPNRVRLYEEPDPMEPPL